MSKKYSRSLLRISVAQICQNLGWHSAQSSSLEVLTDVLERYLLQLGGTCHRYAEQFGRTQANLDDLGLAFRHMGINVSELEDYVRHVDPVPFAHEVVAFPAPKPTNLGFPNPRSREIVQHREEHIPDHMPYMFPNMKDEIPEDKTMSAVIKVDASDTTELPGLEDNKNDDPNSGEKRSAAAISAAEMPPSKRPRFGNSNLPDEAGHSQYEMTCVFMGPNGVLTTRQGVQGRQPEARMPPPNPRLLMESANKENSGKSAEAGVSTKMSLGVGGIGINGIISSKHESKKSKKSLHKKSSLHEVPKTSSESSKKSASSKAAAKFLKKLKTSKKSAKVFSKSKVKEPKLPEAPHKDKHSLEPVKKVQQDLLNLPPAEKVKKKKEKKSAALIVDSDEELLNLPSPTSSGRSSPEGLVITDGEDDAKKKAILEAIDDSINSVLRDGPVKEERDKIRKKKKKEKKGDDISGKTGDLPDGKSHDSKAKRKPGRPPKVTKTPELPPPIDIKPFVSEKYSSAELQVYEFKDSPPDSSMKARRPSATETAAPPPPPPAPPHVPSAQASTKHDHPAAPPSKAAVHRVPKKMQPEDELFAPEIKFESRPEPSEALKDKLKQKVKEEKKFVEDKNKLKQKDEKGDKHKKKKDLPKSNKEHIREDKEKQKERDHKKEKRDKKKEKEKKKKHKEKDRDREKEKKKREDRLKQELPPSRESSPAVGLGVKLKIKIGGSTGPSASVMVTGDSSSPAPSPASLTGSKRDSVSPHKVIPKLYISKSGPGPEEKPKKSTKISHGDTHKSSPITVATKSRSSSPSKVSPSSRSTPTPPAPRKTPTPPPLSKSNVSKDIIQERKKETAKPVHGKERKSRSPVKGGRKERKKERKESLSSLSPDSSLSPQPSIVPRRQTPPKLQRMSSSSSPDKSPPSLPFQSPTPSPKTMSRATRSPSHTSSPYRSPSSPPSLSRRKPTPPPSLSPAAVRHPRKRSPSSLSPAAVRHPRKRSPSPSPTKPPTPGSTSPAQSPELNLPLSPAHHRSPTPTPRTPTASPSRNIPSPSHSSPPGSPSSPRRSPSPGDQPISHSGSRLVESPEPKYLKDNPSPASSGKSSTSTSKPARTVEAETVCVFIDEAGQKVWICPGCKLPDDGTEMIGCDMCDNWYHWPCVNITEAPPESQNWYCIKCLPKTKSSSRGRGRPRGRGRGRGKKKM